MAGQTAAAPPRIITLGEDDPSSILHDGLVNSLRDVVRESELSLQESLDTMREQLLSEVRRLLLDMGNNKQPCTENRPAAGVMDLVISVNEVGDQGDARAALSDRGHGNGELMTVGKSWQPLDLACREMSTDNGEYTTTGCTDFDPSAGVRCCTDESSMSEESEESKAIPISPSFRTTLKTTRSAAAPTMLNTIVRSVKFECVCAVVILLNCLELGIQAHLIAVGYEQPAVKMLLIVSEHFFTVFFLVELGLRVKVFGFNSFVPSTADGRENCLDAFLVVSTGIVLTWVLPLLAFVRGFDLSGSIQPFSALRSFRLVRLVHVFRRVPCFREAWMLIRGISDSVRTLFWTTVVIFFVTYVFAIFGTVLLVEQMMRLRCNASPEDVERIDNLLAITGGLDKLMYTLIQVLTMDSFHSFMREMMCILPWSWVYWYAYMSVACFVLMNLVTAIIVENAMLSSQSDNEHALAEKSAKQQKDLKELKHLFYLMDADGSGTLSWPEFQESFNDPVMSKKWMLLDFQAEDGKELFALLDDGDGEIETAEFFEGLTRMKGPAQAKDVYRLQKTVYKLQAQLADPFNQKPSSKGRYSGRHGTPCSQALSVKASCFARRLPVRNA